MESESRNAVKIKVEGKDTTRGIRTRWDALPMESGIPQLHDGE